MKVMHLVNENGHVSDWGSDQVTKHHRLWQLAKKMADDPRVARFVKSTEMPEQKIEDNGDVKMESRTYFELSKEWVTTDELLALRGYGLSAYAERVELHDAGWTAAISNPWVRCAFVGWNLVLASVVLTQGGVL